MKNVKKLLAVLVVVTMLVTAMIPVMAADTTFSYDAQAKVLWDLKLFLGESATEYVPGLGNDLTREQGVIMLVRLLGAEDDALALTAAQVDAALTFADAADISTWAKAYVAYAKINGYFVGVGDNKAAPGAKLTGKDYCTMVIRALGYTVDAAGWANAANILVEKGGLTAAEAAKFNDKELIRDDAVGITYGALLGKMADGKTLIASLVAAGAVDEAKAQAAGLIPVVADVKDVTISNLWEVVITFTAPVNATEAAKAANYTIAGAAPSAAAVSADAKTVTLTTASQFANYSSYAVVVKKAVGIPADVTKTVRATDITVPSLTSVTTTGPKTIKLTFSEPLAAMKAANVVSALKLDNGTLAITASDVAAGSKTVTISTYVNLAETTHTLVLSGSKFTDMAGYAVQNTSMVFSYVKDTSPLTYTTASVNESKVSITFNKAIAAGTFADNGNVWATHTYNSATYKVLSDKIDTSDNQTFTITFDKPLPPGTTTVFVNYVSTSSTLITDGYGNTIPASFSFPVTTTADVTKPTATVAFVDANTLTVTYSENVTDTALAEANYVLKDSAGTVITVEDAVFTTASSVVKLTTGTMNGGSYTLAISNVADTSIAANVIDAVTLSFTGTDKVAPDMGDITAVAADKVKIAFTEAMDVSTITNKLAYKYGVDSEGGVEYYALASTDTITAAADGKSVVIDFDISEDVHVTMPKYIKVAASTFKDLAGNWVDRYQKTYTIPKLEKLTASAAITSATTIKLTIADPTVTGMTVDDFVYSVNGGAYDTANSIAVEYDASNTYITLYIDSVNTDKTNGAGITVASYAKNTVGANVATITNSFANTLKFIDTSVDDKYAPAVNDMHWYVGDTGKAVVCVHFTEELYVPSVNDTDFAVSGAAVTKVEYLTEVEDGITYRFVEVTTDQTTLSSSTTVALVGPVEDVARNVLASKAATKISSYDD